MALKEKTAAIRGFIIRQLRDEPDISKLTIGILKKRYMVHVKCDSLSPEAKKIIKKVVEEELLKMQENDKSDSESEITKPPNKGKREREQKEAESEEEKQPTAKKSRAYLSSSSSDSEDDEDRKPRSLKPRPDDTKQEMKKSTSENNGDAKQQNASDDSSSEELSESEESGTKSDCSEKTVKKKSNTSKNGETRKISTSVGKKTAKKDQESDSEKSEKSDKINDSESSDDEKEENVLAEKKNDSSSDSSSLPSLEEDNKIETEDAKEVKKKRMKKDPSTRGQKDDDKAVVRLKRYIALCGVWRNYKKLLDGCRSTRSKVAVLKKELENLGVHGQPSIEKCKKIRVKREEAREVAELDVGNIITTEGRPKRRGTLARQEQRLPISTYQRTLNSGSDSDHENNADKGRRKMSEWTNLRGIISDDADSD